MRRATRGTTTRTCFGTKAFGCEVRVRRNAIVRSASEDAAGTTEKPVVPKAAPKGKGSVTTLRSGDVVRVIKEEYEGSLESLASQSTSYTGLDYIYEDRGEVLEVKVFQAGEYALVAWAGIPTAPAWLPARMLQKSDALDYVRM